MSKYDPLTSYLRAQGARELRMSFAEVEGVLGFPLPASRKYPAWWSNSPSNNPMTNAWLAAGYRTEQVDVSGEKLTFRSSRPPHREAGAAAAADASRSPLFGSMKGTTIVMPGVDLTAPMDFGDWDPETFDPEDVIVGEEVERVKRDPDLNTSDKIRALAKLGMPRAEIARQLGKRYQHVRNVLEAEKGKAT